MFGKVIFNKSKDKSIVFIHGLFTTSGYWLPYLPFFKNYKIILIDINYYLLFDEIENKNFQKNFNKNFNLDSNVVAIVAHSLGTLVSKLIRSNTNLTYYNICPIENAQRKQKDDFINEIFIKIQKSKKFIRNMLLKTDHFINNFNNFNHHSSNLTISFIPKNDEYFIYDYELECEKIYVGDHFEILNAISEISQIIKN